MSLLTVRHARRALVAVVLVGLTLAAALPAAAVTARVQPRTASTTPPWEPDPGSVGGLTFYNAAGQPVVSGSITASPIAPYVGGTATIRTGDTKATLYGYLPVDGESPAQWSGEPLGASTTYPNPSAPAPLNTSSLPLETGGNGDETIAQLEADFPNTDTSNDGYADMYVLRLKTTAADKPANTTYDSADIEITGDTWTEVYPTSLAASTTTVSASPSPTTAGTTVTYTVTVSGADGSPTGTATISVGATTLCTTPDLSAGTAQCTAANAPTGADTVSATYSGDTTYTPSTGTTTLVVTSGPYSPLAPQRICDTRAGNPSGLSGAATQCNGAGDIGSPIIAGGTKDINVANADSSFGVPADATAVVVNVTAIAPSSQGHLTVFSAGAALPVASNVNYTAGQVIPNLVEVGVGTGGDIAVNSSAAANVAVDIEGYVAATAAGGDGAGLYTPLTSPVRICDTRSGNPSGLNPPNAQCNGKTLTAGGSIDVQVAGQDDVPTGAAAAVFNVTVANPAGSGYLSVYPAGGSKPLVSNVNYTAGQTTSNRVIVPLATATDAGQITVSSSAAADVLVDLSGYFSASGGSGAQFSAEAAPVRICDTRTGNPSGLSGGAAQCAGKPIGVAGTLTLNVSGLAGVPADATAVVVNLTGISPSAKTFLTVFPAALPSPLVSDLNEVAGQNKANLTVATLSGTSTISIYNNTGQVNVAVDVLGWYS